MKKHSVVFVLILALLISICVAAQASTNTWKTAEPLTFNKTYTGRDDSPFYAEGYWYKISLPSSGCLSITYSIIPETTFCPDIELYDNDNNVGRIWNEIPSVNRTTGEARSTASVYLLAGTYYLAIGAETSSSLPTVGDYSISCSFTSARETISESLNRTNNTNKTADAVLLNTTYRGMIGKSNDEVDYYKFVLTESNHITFDYHFDMESISIKILDASGSKKWEKKPSWNSFVGYGEETTEIDLSSGTFFLVFECDKDMWGRYFSGTYSFAIKATPEPTVTTPEPTITTPAPVITTPVPVITTPAPVITTPAPTIITPEPTIITPEPTIITPEPVDDDHVHRYKEIITPATLNVDGEVQYICKCGDIISFTIPHPVDIHLENTHYEYSGKEQKPDVVILLSDGSLLDDYYTVKYSSGRKKIGKYTVTIKFNGWYLGCDTVTLKYSITPAIPKITSLKAEKGKLTVRWSKVSNAEGYDIHIATNTSFTANKSSARFKKNTITSKQFTRLKSKKTYYVRMRSYKMVDGMTIWSAWSEPQSVKTK